jgi:hypothetical protein
MNIFSPRFNKPIILTHHAIEQMKVRKVTEKILLDLIELGEIQYKDTEHLWIYKPYQNRKDNMLCVAAIERNNLIVKTVMINWELNDEHKIL